MDKGSLFVLTGASGVGKGTVRKRLMERVSIRYSISMTTRLPRRGEQHGVDYWFVEPEDFATMVSSGGFLEWAQYVDDRYGTPAAPVEKALTRGEDVMLEIEVQGALQVVERVPEAVLIFLLPPSLSELRRRLLFRDTDSPGKIRKRLERAEQELKLSDRFGYLVVNDVLERAVEDLLDIVRAERLRPGRMQPAVRAAGERDGLLEIELNDIENKLGGEDVGARD